MKTRFQTAAALGVAVAALMVSDPAPAQNSKGGSGGSTGGVIVIDQAKAEAGGVTPGDDPGFPITISQPGSYRLMSNLTVGAGLTAIEVTASQVTLDLNGFALMAPGTCTGNVVNGIVCQNLGGAGVASNSQHFVTVRNGQIKGFHTGVSLYYNSLAEDLTVLYANTGIKAMAGSRALRNSVKTASQDGIFMGEGVVRENYVQDASTAVMTSTAALVERNFIRTALTGIRGYAGTATATGNLLRYTQNPFQQVVQMGPNTCDGLLCQ